MLSSSFLPIIGRRNVAVLPSKTGARHGGFQRGMLGTACSLLGLGAAASVGRVQIKTDLTIFQMQALFSPA